MAWNNFEDSCRLYGGDRDDGGLANVNYNWRDNRNSNIAARPLVVSSDQQKRRWNSAFSKSRSYDHGHAATARLCAVAARLHSVVDFNQPPIILPASIIFSSRTKYFSLFKDSVSWASRTSIFKRSVLSLALISSSLLLCLGL